MAVTREQLFAEVWSEPMTTVAARYGVSSNYLARVCEQLNVPRPSRGYWAKIQNGFRIEAPRLPDVRLGQAVKWSRDESEPLTSAEIGSLLANSEEQPTSTPRAESAAAASRAVRITREHLYEAVWAKPLRVLADEYRVTAGEIANACVRLAVPRPPAGHWTRLQFAKDVERPPLPPRGASIPIEVTFEAASAAPTPAVPVVPIAPAGARLHPLVVQVREALKGQRVDENGMQSLRGSYVGATVRLSAATRDRGLRALDALVRALEARGHAVSFTKPRESYGAFKLAATIAGEVIGLAISEHLNQRAHVLSREEEERVKRFASAWTRKFDQSPSGRLTLRIDVPYRATPQSKWSDGDRRRIEDVLGHVIVAMEEAITIVRRQRDEDARRQRAVEDEARRREEARRRTADDEKRVATLRVEIDRWRLAREIREYVTARRSVASARTGGDERFESWAAWALSYADRLDPILDPRWEVRSGPQTPS